MIFEQDLLNKMDNAINKTIENYNGVLETCEMFHKKTELIDLQQSSALYERLLFIKNFIQSQKNLHTKLIEINEQWLKVVETQTNQKKQLELLTQENEELRKKNSTLELLINNQ